MQQLLGIDADAPYDARLQQLAERGVGLWDVIGECARRGSLDAAIVPGSIVVNPLPERLATLPQLRLVVCNGSAAAQAWRRHVQPALSPPLTRLPVQAVPSTSPANAAWSLRGCARRGSPCAMRCASWKAWHIAHAEALRALRRACNTMRRQKSCLP